VSVFASAVLTTNGVNFGRWQSLRTHPIEVALMIDTPRSPDDIDAVPERESPPRTPRWVKWSVIVVGVLVLLLLSLPLLGVQHGPGRHLPGGDAIPASTAPGAITPNGGHG
jgi:hypothetical protein